MDDDENSLSFRQDGAAMADDTPKILAQINFKIPQKIDFFEEAESRRFLHDASVNQASAEISSTSPVFGSFPIGFRQQTDKQTNPTMRAALILLAVPTASSFIHSKPSIVTRRTTAIQSAPKEDTTSSAVIPRETASAGFTSVAM